MSVSNRLHRGAFAQGGVSARAGAAGPSRGSWTALLAATTLGVAGASTLHAEVRSDAPLDASRSYRLIVQSYDRGQGDSGSGTVHARERPVASMQRAVTPQELKFGVRVGLVELRQGRLPGNRPGNRPGDTDSDDAVPGNFAKAVVLAWVEEGKPDLELDGLRARPQPGGISGAAARIGSQAAVRISVRERVRLS